MNMTLKNGRGCGIADIANGVAVCRIKLCDSGVIAMVKVTRSKGRWSEGWNV